MAGFPVWVGGFDARNLCGIKTAVKGIAVKIPRHGLQKAPLVRAGRFGLSRPCGSGDQSRVVSVTTVLPGDKRTRRPRMPAPAAQIARIRPVARADPAAVPAFSASVAAVARCSPVRRKALKSQSAIRPL